MKQFLVFGPFGTLFFLMAMPVDIVKNYRSQKYSSGSLVAWVLRIIGYSVFGIYLLVKGEYVAGAAQFVGLILASIIVIQKFLYQGKQDSLIVKCPTVFC